MISFIGPPSCGKGTQSLIFNKKHNCNFFSFGEFLRKEIIHNTDFGKSVKKRMDNGQLILTKEIFENMDLSIFSLPKLILDGFPRNLEQIEYFYKFCNENKLIIDSIFEFKADDCILIDRVCNRVICNKCLKTFSKQIKKCECGSTIFNIREDDKIEIFEKRLNHYKKNKNRIRTFACNFYEYKTINANQNIETITEDLELILSNWLI